MNLYRDVCEATEETANLLDSHYRVDFQGREDLAKLARRIK